MVIGGCDKEKNFTELLDSKIRDYMEKKGHSDFEIRKFTNSRDLLKCITEMNLVLLDIEVEEKNSGIWVKNYVSFLRRDIRLIFVTKHSEMIMEAFGKYVYAFLQKKDIDTRLDLVLDKALMDFDFEQ